MIFRNLIKTQSFHVCHQNSIKIKRKKEISTFYSVVLSLNEKKKVETEHFEKHSVEYFRQILRLKLYVFITIFMTQLVQTVCYEVTNQRFNAWKFQTDTLFKKKEISNKMCIYWVIVDGRMTQQKKYFLQVSFSFIIYERRMTATCDCYDTFLFFTMKSSKISTKSRSNR